MFQANANSGASTSAASGEYPGQEIDYYEWLKGIFPPDVWLDTWDKVGINFFRLLYIGIHTVVRLRLSLEKQFEILEVYWRWYLESSTRFDVKW